MPTFTDTEARTWTLSLNVTTAKRLKAQGLDLIDALDDALERLIGDPMLLADTLWSLCQTQAKERDIDEEAFGSALGGDSIDQATTALLEAIAGFFPSHRRAAMRHALTKLERYQQIASEETIARLDDPAEEERIRTMIRNAMAGEPSMNSPGSPASTPAP